MKNHYENVRQHNSLKHQIEMCDIIIDRCKREIKECDYDIEVPMKSMDYEAIRVQTSGVSNSTEDACMSAHDKVEETLNKTIEDKSQKEDEVKILEASIKMVDQVLDDIPYEHCRYIFEAIYRFNTSLRVIGKRINYTHTGVAKVRDKALDWILSHGRLEAITINPQELTKCLQLLAE